MAGRGTQAAREAQFVPPCDEAPEDYVHVRNLIDYDPVAGTLTWRVRPETSFQSTRIARSWNTRHAGKPALSCVSLKGYREGTLSEALVKAHRVAWLLHYGVWPNGPIDHINGDRADNRIDNLREATPAENSRNKGKYRNNKSGVTGVYWHGQSRRWRASARLNGKNYHFGSFASADEAKDARDAGIAKLGVFSERHGAAHDA